MQSKAVLAQRKADLLNAEIELKREEDLFKKQAVSESQYQQAQTRYQVAQASYEAADYAVQSSEAQLRDFSRAIGQDVHLCANVRYDQHALGRAWRARCGNEPDGWYGDDAPS